MNTSSYLLTNNDPKVTSYESTLAVVSVVCQAFYWKDFGGFYIRFIWGQSYFCQSCQV